MAVKIRLRRMGRTNTPFFRIVATDSRCPPDGRFLEILGWYDPMKKDGVDCVLDMDRVDYWRGNGAEVTHSVRNLINKMARRQPVQATAIPPETPAQPEAESVPESPETDPGAAE